MSLKPLIDWMVVMFIVLRWSNWGAASAAASEDDRAALKIATKIVIFIVSI
jgi:hypothetical protein